MNKMIKVFGLVLFISLSEMGFTIDFTSKQIGQIKARKINEASGMVVSKINPDVLWVINDSGSKPDIHALTLKGKRLGRIRLSNANNRDWEDLAIFKRGGQSYIVVADVGDNRSVHRTSRLIFVSEPDIDIFKKSKKQSAESHLEWTFVYEDGPRDCEAIAVDEQLQIIYLMSKRTMPPLLYQLPLTMTEQNKPLIAKRVTPVSKIPQPTLQDIQEDKKYGQFCNQPTALDIRDNKMVILTYKRLFLYQKDSNKSWAETLLQSPESIQFPSLEQAEAMCIHPDNGSILITSEGKKPPILQISFP